MNNVRYTFRQLRKSPAFMAVAVLTLALGIGANTAIFSVINAVLLAPLPYPQPDRIMTLNEFSSGTNSAIAFPDYLDWRRDNTVFEALAISRRESRNLSGIADRQPERVGVAFVTANPPQGATPDVILAATNAAAVHGFGVAFMWSSVIFAAALTWEKMRTSSEMSSLDPPVAATASGCSLKM